MDNDFDLDLDEGVNREEIISRKDKKINSLGLKLGESEKEKAEIAQKEAEARTKAEAAEKERDFFKGFNTIATKYPGAADHQEAIWERVQKGTDAEEATIAVLVKEGKYTPPPQEQVQPLTAGVAGGSASTSIIDQGSKTPDTMTQDERRAALKELESRGEFGL